ncbi:MAG: acetate--CoA ligase family protein [Patescibacteria group bacterium]|jgi:acetyltransferase
MFDHIFKPKSIALIGASRSPGSLGHDVLENIKKLGFKGKIYPVNLKANQILGLTCYPSVLNIKGNVDLAIIMVPANFVANVLEECGKKKIKGVIIISAGFKETGEAGAAREEQVKAIIKKYKIDLIGPNCLGIINPHINLNASFADGMPEKGKVGLISQSGAMAVAIMDWAYQSKIGFSKIISIGNKAGLSEIDLMKYLAQDPETKVIMMYLESITDGQAFMKLSDKITNTKPIIVLKSGTSSAGVAAISSHTGSLAGSDRVIKTAFKQCGVIRAKTVEDLFDFAKAFSLAPLPRGNRVAIITNAGGPGIMATDALSDTHLVLAKFTNETNAYLHRHLPKSASVHNPVDIIGDALADRYQLALEAVLSDKNVDAVITILTPQTMTQEDETAYLASKLAKKSRKPIIAVFMGGEDVNSGRLILQKFGVPNFDYCERAVRSLDKMYFAKKIKTDIILAKYQGKNKKLNFSTRKCQIRTVEAEKILQEYDLPVLKSTLIPDKAHFKKINYWPVALKIASRDIIHKKAAGAVVVNNHTPFQAEKSFDLIVKNVKKSNPQGEIEGVLAQPMAKGKGMEVVVGMKRDVNFGPTIMFGLGGSFVEVFKDVSFRLAPLTKKDALKQMAEIKSFRVIEEYDIDLLAEIIVKISHLSLDYPQIRELDLNPIIIQKKGGHIIDVRMLI